MPQGYITNISELREMQNSDNTFYPINGIPIKLSTSGHLPMNQLRRGIYIVNGQKIAIH